MLGPSFVFDISEWIAVLGGAFCAIGLCSTACAHRVVFGWRFFSWRWLWVRRWLFAFGPTVGVCTNRNYQGRCNHNSDRPHPDCAVEKVVNAAIEEALAEAEALLIARLGRISLAELARSFDAHCASAADCGVG